MKHTAKRWLVSGVAMLLVLSMVLGLSMAAFAAEAGKKFDLTDSDKDGKFNYVSIGASNTNGYGIRGYITDQEINDIMSGKVSKDQVNVYGYQRSPEGSYTDLVADYLEANSGAKVNHDQLAISSMRVEEVRVLLDNDYYGDAYTRWRFIGGWFEIAEPGGMEALRQKYQSAVKEADLITLDIGWNNFGVYVCNRLTSYLETGKGSYTADLTEILGEGSEAVAEDIVSSLSTQVKSLLTAAGATGLSDEDIRFVSETFAYALVGYIYNFDIVMGKIYELNPDAQVVVLGVQNLLHGADASVDGEPLPLKLGDVYGEIVNMANVYTEKMSPYKDKYIYTMTGDATGHVNTFLDEIKGYNGDPTTLNPNIKDCFDIYDEDLMIKSRLIAIMDAEYGNLLGMIDMSAAEFVAAGEAGTLKEDAGFYGKYAVDYYDKFVNALNAAYDTAAEIMCYIANKDTLELTAVNGDINAAEDALGEYLINSIIGSARASLKGETYKIDYSIFENTTNSFAGIINVRFYIGNSFFAHPSNDGHKEIYDDVINAANGGKVTTVTTMFADQLESVVSKIACEKTSHYGSVSWKWAEDYSTATATQSCYRCNKTGTASASMADKTITKTTVEPTCAAAGKTVYTAKVTLLGKEVTSTKEVAGEAAKPHTLDAVAEVPATNEQNGTKAHYKCSVCGKLFLDKDGKQEVKAEDLVITISHDLTEVKEVPATCETAGIKGYYKCSDCGKLFLDKDGKQEVQAADLVIAATGHKPVAVKEVPATCDTAGTKAHYKCACGKLYADAEGKTEVKAEDLAIAATGHKMTEVKEVPATCERDGAKGYYKCSVCSKMYADKDGKTEVKDADLVIKGGHQYKDGICTVCGHDINEYEVFRVFGANRYETAFEVAEVLKETLKVEKFQSVVVASGTNFADALAGSYLAAKKDAPILLVNNYTMVSVKDYIRANVAEGGTVYLLGGEAAISKAMEDGLTGYTVKRLAGDNRYDTNLAIVMEAGIPEDGEILVCTGKKFADSLSASAVGKPILLVKDKLNDNQKKYLGYLDTKFKFIIIGGESAVSASLAKELEAYGTIERVGGANRYETSTLLAERFFEKPVPTSAVLAYAKKFPDGLCGGPLAYSLGAPMILTQTGSEDAAVKYTTANKIGSGYVLGGTGLISDESAKEIFGADKIGVK